MGGLRGIGLLGVLVLAMHAAPAMAANHVVMLGNGDKIGPAAVTIDPGDRVTWDWVGPEYNHSPEALYGQKERWDADGDGDGAYPHPPGPNFWHDFTYSGVFQYRCTVHPDTMQGTITVRGPNAKLSATSTPVIGKPVTFDASQSTGGPLTYKWDLDGNGTFDAGRTHAQETVTYATGQRVPISVQATDSAGRRSMALLSVTPREPTPVAAFLVTPTVTRPNTPVTFDASGTTDPDGDIATYEWDLDGDPSTGPGGFEVGTGTDPHATRSYQGTGTRDIRLRVTDAAGHSSIAIEELTITNVAPTADFPAPDGRAGQGVTFDGSSSSDPDGTIARYEWDFDGDGTYETDAGAAPKAAHVYGAEGTFTVRLRVTDSGGAVAATTRTVRIAARVVPGPGDGSRPPTPVLRLSVGGQAIQRALRSRRVVVRVSCNQACTVLARGTMRIADRRAVSLRRVTGRMSAGSRITLRLGLSSSAVAQVRRALAARRRATVKVDLIATGTGGSRAVATRRIVMRR